MSNYNYRKGEWVVITNAKCVDSAIRRGFGEGIPYQIAYLNKDEDTGELTGFKIMGEGAVGLLIIQEEFDYIAPYQVMTPEDVNSFISHLEQQNVKNEIDRMLENRSFENIPDLLNWQ